MLGWHQGKAAYKSLADIQALIASYATSKIPLESIWNDVSYMNARRVFTVDPVAYAGLGAYVADTMHKNGQKYVPIVGAGLAYTPDDYSYRPFRDGLASKVFINEFSNQNPFVGTAIGGQVVYPDWTATNTAAFWSSQLDSFLTLTNFDALWLDSNEATNFCNGACLDSQIKPQSVKLSMPYWPTGRDLNEQSIDLDAVHANNRNELEMHNVFALQQTKLTHDWFQNKKMRVAIASRASFAGQGKFGGRSFGENYSTVEDMKASVAGVMTMNIFGIPIGAPNVCGFIGDVSAELCARWTKLSSFYPYARNHHDGDASPVSAAFAGEYKDARVPKTTFRDIMTVAIEQKYNLIPYAYSNLIELRQKGGVYFKPLFFAFPEDLALYNRNFNDFLLGDSLKVSIEVTKLGATRSQFYFPTATWCPLWEMDSPCLVITGNNKDNLQELYSSADVSHVHMREGKIVVTANLWNAEKIMTTKDMRALPVDLHLAPMLNGAGNVGFQAFEDMWYTDDGENFDSTDLTKGSVNGYQFYMSAFTSAASWLIEVQHKLKATQSTDTTCFAMSGNDYLGDVYVHNAPSVGIQLDNYIG